MKVWIKLLIGCALGMTIGFLLPESETTSSALHWLEQLSLGIGRYAVIPILVFSLTISVYELRIDGQFWRMAAKNMLFILIASTFVIFLGIMNTLLFPPARIPIERAEQLETFGLNVADNVIDLFPSNMLSVLTGDGIYLLPVCVFAFFLGMGLNYERNFGKPVIAIIDSLSRIFYHIATFFSEIIGFILIVLSAYWAVRFNGILRLGIYNDIIIKLGVFSVILCFGILPLCLYFLKPKVNPWHILYGSIGPAIAAFFSGDFNFSIPVLQRHTKENFGVRRRSSALSVALFSAFCRGGSAMVAASAFIVIIRSYSFLSISTSDLLSIGIYALGFSFLLARHPGDGAHIALAVLCLSYGGGEYRAGHLILKPIIFYLIAIGTFIDVMLTVYGSYVVAKISGYANEKEPKRYI